MKKVISLILILMMIMSIAGSAIADVDIYIYVVYESGSWSCTDESGHTTYYQDIPPHYDSYLLDQGFPTWVASMDVSSIREKWHGTPIGLLGLSSDKGINLRTMPNLKDSTRGIQLHAGTTVYVYFKCYNIGREWYYASTAEGQCGFLNAKFLQLYPYSLSE